MLCILDNCFPRYQVDLRLGELDLSELVSLWFLLLPLCQVCSRSECRFGYKVVMFLSGCFMCPRVELAVNGVLGI